MWCWDPGAEPSTGSWGRIVQKNGKNWEIALENGGHDDNVPPDLISPTMRTDAAPRDINWDVVNSAIMEVAKKNQTAIASRALRNLVDFTGRPVTRGEYYTRREVAHALANVGLGDDSFHTIMVMV